MNVPSRAQSSVCAACEEGDCHLKLGGLAGSVTLLCFDDLKVAYHHSGNIADCGILWQNKDQIATVELKGGRKDVNVLLVVKQLQGASSLLERVVDGQSVSAFFPVLLYRGVNDPTAAFAGRQITFRNKGYPIIVRTCGSKLAEVIGKKKERRGRRSRLGSRR